MKKLISCLLVVFTISSVYADSLREQRHQHVLAYAGYIRSKVVGLKPNTTIAIFLKNGTIVRGIFKNYISYDDSVWIQPLNNTNMFSAQAFDMTEIYDVVVVVVRPV